MYASLKKTTPYLFFSDLVDLEFHLLFLQLLQMPGFEPSAWLGIPPCKSTWHSRKTIQPTKNLSYPRLPNTLGLQVFGLQKHTQNTEPEELFGKLGLKTKKQIDQANSSWKTYHGRSYKMGIGKPVISEGYKIPKIFFTPMKPIYF